MYITSICHVRSIEVIFNIYFLSSGFEYMTNSNVLVDNSSSRFICPNCGPLKSYKTKGSLTRHLKEECGVEPKFQCARCKRKFKLKHNLVAHERMVCRL